MIRVNYRKSHTEEYDDIWTAMGGITRWINKNPGASVNIRHLDDKRFEHKLEIKYGKGFLADLERITKNPYITLEEIGQKYGITREYVRQCLGKIFPSYKTKDRITRRERRAEDTNGLSCPMHPINKLNDGSTTVMTLARAAVFQKCHEYGFEAEYLTNSLKGQGRTGPRGGLALIRGRKCYISGSIRTSKTVPGANITYHRFNLRRRDISGAEFVILSIPNEETPRFYIIPLEIDRIAHSKAKDINIYIPENSSNNARFKNVWDQWRSRWDLLAS